MKLVVKNLPANAGDLRDEGSIPGSGRSPRDGNDNPLQYYSLENLMDRGAWRATVHGVANSWTWLKQLSIHASKNKTRQNRVFRKHNGYFTLIFHKVLKKGKKSQYIFKHFEVLGHVLCGFTHSFFFLLICIFRKYFLNGKCLRHTEAVLTDTSLSSWCLQHPSSSAVIGIESNTIT